MASTSARALTLLSVLAAGGVHGATALARRLGASERTVRRDVETLRELGYDIGTVNGSGGGYRLRGDERLGPMVFDDDQAVAIAIALQTAPTVIDGIGDSNRRALSTVRQVMSERLRAESDAFTVTSVPNYWEFPAPPIDADIVRAVGSAVRRRHVLRAEYVGSGADTARVRVEPHRIVVWAARWYVVAFDLDERRWRVLRLDRLRAGAPSYQVFDERAMPAGGAERFVMTSHDRGDTPAPWPCQGSALIDVPAHLTAEFAPGGAVVERVGDTASRLHMGAWSWVGLAGLFITFAADLREVEPAQLREAFVVVRDRLRTICPE